MLDRSLRAALAPALLATLFGTVALIVWGHPVPGVAAAVVGAACGALPGLRGRRPTPPEPVPSEPPGLAGDGSDELGAVLDALPLGVLVVEVDRTLGAANAMAREMFGLGGITGQPMAMLRARRLLDCIDAALDRRTANTLEMTLPRAGDAFLRAHVRPLGAGGVLVAIEDETLARRADESHRDFVANASHELKTPLAAVSGIIETLLGHARDDRQATERFLGQLAAQTHRMIRLIEDLMSLNRIETNERVPPVGVLDLVAVVSETVAALAPIAETAGVALTFDSPGGPTPILGDRDELAQLFGNLIDNAIKYGGEGTTVRVCQIPAPPASDGQIGITVEDRGPGIAREHLPRLTERFYRVNVRQSRAKGGTGLGLAIVKHIVNRHRGRLEIDSTPGSGSRFTVWLPLAGGASNAHEAAGA